MIQLKEVKINNDNKNSPYYRGIDKRKVKN